MWLIFTASILSCLFDEMTYSEFTPFYHELGLGAHEKGVEGDVIDREIHPALLG